MREKQGYLYEGGKAVHRKVWADAYGKVPKGWVVHHIDFVKTNNALENLIALPEWLHDDLHERMRVERMKMSRDQLWPLYLEYMGYYEVNLKALDTKIEELRKLRLEFKSAGISPTTFMKLLLHRLFKSKILSDKKAAAYCERVGPVFYPKSNKKRRTKQGPWTKVQEKLKKRGIVSLPCDIG